MTYTALTLALSNASSAAFRLWGKGISDQLTAMGLTKTADTGQIDWATVAAPGTAGTAAGYEIRQFTDTLAPTTPIVFKIEYGAGISSVANPGLWITVGSASDGAGTLTNNTGDANAVTTRRQMLGNANYSAGETGLVHCWVASDGSAFGLLMWPSVNTTIYTGGFIGVERWRDPDGAPNTAGWTFFGAIPNSAVYQSSKSKGTALTQPTEQTSNWLAPGISAFSSTAIGTTLYPIPVFTAHQAKMYAPSQMLLVIGHQDLNANATFSVSHYGVSRTFVSAGSGLNTGLGNGFPYTTLGGPSGIGPKGFAMRAD